MIYKRTLINFNNMPTLRSVVHQRSETWSWLYIYIYEYCVCERCINARMNVNIYITIIIAKFVSWSATLYYYVFDVALLSHNVIQCRNASPSFERSSVRMFTSSIPRLNVWQFNLLANKSMYYLFRIIIRFQLLPRYLSDYIFARIFVGVVFGRRWLGGILPRHHCMHWRKSDPNSSSTVWQLVENTHTCTRHIESSCVYTLEHVSSCSDTCLRSFVFGTDEELACVFSYLWTVTFVLCTTMRRILFWECRLSHDNEKYITYVV